MRKFTILAAALLIAPASRAQEPWADPALKLPPSAVLWLDASRQPAAWQAHGRTLASGNLLDAFYDASGNSLHLVQRVQAAQPRWQQAGARAVVRFDGKDDFLGLSGLKRTLENGTLFIVAVPRSNAGGFRGLFACNQTGKNDYTTGLNVDLRGFPSATFDRLNVEGRGFGGAVNLLQTSQPFGKHHVIEVRLEPDAVQVVLDGAAPQKRKRSPGVVSMEQLALAARCYSNSAEPPFMSGFFDGDIAEVILFERALKPEESRALTAQLQKKYADLDKHLTPATQGHRLQVLADPPPVQMLLPGFTVKQLALDLPHINNVLYRHDGKLVALGYNGNIYVLSDKDGDGLEEDVELFWDNRGRLVAPVGMDLTPPGYAKGDGVFVASKGKIALIVDADRDGKADQEIIVATGWQPLPHGVDALGVALAKDGSVWFGLGTADFTNAYLLDKGKAGYDVKSARGTIIKVSPDFKTREIVATGIRFPVAVRFNHLGDLFCTDQEGATWLPNGNPLDELLHIQPGRHYGFPPRHPKHLPNVIDEPSTFDYGPQHQSTCGLNFNGLPPSPPWGEGLGVRGGPNGEGDNGPAPRGQKISRRSSASVAGQPLTPSPSPQGGEGGSLRPQRMGRRRLRLRLLARQALPHQAREVARRLRRPDSAHRLFEHADGGRLCVVRRAARRRHPQRSARLGHRARRQGQAVQTLLRPQDPRAALRLRAQRGPRRLRSAARSGPLEGPRQANEDRVRPVRPARRPLRDAETALRDRAAAGPGAAFRVGGARRVDHAGSTDVDRPDRDASAGHPLRAHAPGFGPAVEPGRRRFPQLPAVELGYDLSGIYAEWATQGERWSGWLPHLDMEVARTLTQGSADHERLWQLLRTEKGVGDLKLRSQVNAWQMLQPAVQPGAMLDHTQPPELVRVRCTAPNGGLSVLGPDSIMDLLGGRGAWSGATATLKPQDDKLARLDIQHGTSTGQVRVAWCTSEDPRWRPLPLHRLLVPWAKPQAGPTLVERIHPALEGGNWLAGRALFFGDAAQCARCHVAGGQGGKIGPDLSNLVHRDYDSVLRDLRFPSATLNPDHLSYVVTTHDGRVLLGTVRSEDKHVIVGANDGKEHRLAKEDVESARPSPVSTMPEGIDKKLTPVELRDLLTYLLTEPLKPAPLERADAPPPRARAEVDAILKTRLPIAAPLRKVRVVLAAGPKDHGPGEHDYPLWQRRWLNLLSLAEDVQVSTATGWPTPPQWQTADVIVFYSHHAGWSGEKATDLDAFLARGGGLVYVHYAVEGHKDADVLAGRIGLAWRGGQSRFRHGPLELTFPDPKHPITRGFTKTRFVDESYWKLTGDPKRIHPLATGIEDGVAQPLFWAREHGKGRVFVSILGHYTWTFDDPLFRILMLRGLAWSAHEPADRWLDLATIGARVGE